MRPGYSPDEEFTVMAVRGIAEHGLPILPSGLLYDRGIVYSYVSWLVHAITGSELPAYRAISLLAALIALWLVFKLIWRVRNRMAGVIGMALVATSVPFWATATSGRFYAPFLALYLGTLLVLRRSFVAIVALALLSRLTHELAFTLAMVPAIASLIDRDDRAAWLRATIAVVIGLVAGQALLFVLHWLTPTSGETMVRRFFLWQVLNLFVRPGNAQYTLPLALIPIAYLAAPKRAWPLCLSAVSVAVMIVAFSIARASNRAPLSIALVQGVLEEGSRYPLHMFWHIASTTPLTLLIALGLLSLRLAGAGGEWRLPERALHGLWIGWVVWFGVIDSGITTNYLLVPVSLMLMAVANDITALVRIQPRAIANVAAIAIVALIGWDQWRGTSLGEARPTIVVDGIDEIRNSLKPNDRVACTDELGCMMLVGRIDRWLALDDFVRERFIVQRNQQPTGVYTGVPAVFHPGELFDRNSDGTSPGRIVIVDVFKDYPIGNSRSWLPRAIAEDGIDAHVLLETPQARVIEITPPARNAATDYTDSTDSRVARWPAFGRPHVGGEVPEE